VSRGAGLRGGAWNNQPQNVVCAIRNGNDADDRNNNIGFRCAKTPGAKKQRANGKKLFIVRPIFPEFGGSRVDGAWNNGCS